MPEERNIITKQELIDWLNSRIQRHEDCRDISILSVYYLPNASADDNNWSIGSANTGGLPREIYEPVCQEAIRLAQHKFNIEPE